MTTERSQIIQRYRDRALQLRIIAQGLTSAAAKQILLKTAQHYDDMAKSLADLFSPAREETTHS